MNKKILLLGITLLCISSCKTKTKNKENDVHQDYGVFLGLNDSNNNVNRLLNYDEIVIEIEAFSDDSIKKLQDSNVQIDAYLSVGSLENYKPYYNEFKDYTFMDYENWPDERWIDVSYKPWQDKLMELATKYKSLGATGLFLDNYDVYYIALEEYKEKDIKEEIFEGLVDITNKLASLDLKLIFNSGIDFLERLQEEEQSTFKHVYGLNQENVFASIVDYEKDIFGKQNNEDHEYLIKSVEFFSTVGVKIYLLEYTKDDELAKEIVSYCNNHNFKYYISSTVGLY